MRKAIIVDLDGTLLRTNTFKEYIVFILKYWYLRLDIAIVLFFLVGLRKIRVISHETMKYYILLCTKSFMTAKRLSDFASLLMTKVNSNVLSVIQQFRDWGGVAYLSTAAPSSYASIIADRLNLEGYCATELPLRDKEWHENVRDVKCKSTLDFLQEKGVVFDVLLTDHYDDLPLLKVAKSKNYLVNPNKKTVELARAANVKFAIIK